MNQNHNKLLASQLKQILGLEREPVGVSFMKELPLGGMPGFDTDTKTRYCQALMRAGQGEQIVISASNISCPASAAAFGLKPLPDKLANGEMLLMMGLFASPEAGKKAMEGMTRLPMDEYRYVTLSPLTKMNSAPDVVVFESVPEHLMWLALASIYETGERLQFDTAIFQATCVDSTVIPFVSGKMNASLGCYGCREATNIEDSESLLGLPFDQLAALLDSLHKLADKPMIKARSKSAYQSFSGCGE